MATTAQVAYAVLQKKLIVLHWDNCNRKVDRLSLLTYLSSLYHALEENPCKGRMEDKKSPERDQDECLDLGHSLEEESICSSCSSSSGYASPVGKGRKEHLSELKAEQGEGDEAEVQMDLKKTKVKEVKDKFEKTMRRSGAEARRESRRLVKSMCDENTQGTLGAQDPSLGDLGERETPFLVALRKFSSLALSQTKIPMATSCPYKTNVREDPMNGKKLVPSIDDSLTVAPRAFNSLITRATQTEEERRSAEVQTTSTTKEVQPARMTTDASEITGFNHNSTLTPSKTVKNHQRRTSIHSRQHAFQLPPHHQPHLAMLHQTRPTGTGGDCQGNNTTKLQDLQSPHLSMQVLPQQEYVWPGPGLAVLPKYKREARRSLRSNLRSSKSTPHLYLQSKKTSIDLQPYARPIGQMQLVSGLPQTYSTLV